MTASASWLSVATDTAMPRLIGILNSRLPAFGRRIEAGIPGSVINASTTLTSESGVRLVDTSLASVTVTLPVASVARGRVLTVKKTKAPNTLTIAGAGAETIDGAPTVAVTVQWDTYTLWSDGASWFVI